MAKLIITAKCSDQCAISYVDDNGKLLTHNDSYVPVGITIGGPDDDGDYIDIEIDTKTGNILNWKQVSETNIIKAIKQA